jgi:hypothetical protein
VAEEFLRRADIAPGLQQLVGSQELRFKLLVGAPLIDHCVHTCAAQVAQGWAPFAGRTLLSETFGLKRLP